MSHIDTVQQWLAQNNYDIAYISNYKTIAYFTGFESDPIERTLALFIFPDHEPFIFAPALEVGSVKEAGWKYPVYGYLDHEDPYALIKSYIDKINPDPQKWAIEKENRRLKDILPKNFAEIWSIRQFLAGIQLFSCKFCQMLYDGCIQPARCVFRCTLWACARRRREKEEHHEPFTPKTRAGTAVRRRPARGSHDGQLHPGGLCGWQRHQQRLVVYLVWPVHQ